MAMGTSEVTKTSQVELIKTILVGISLVFGAIAVLAALAATGGQTVSYGIIGVALVAQAVFYWWM